MFLYVILLFDGTKRNLSNCYDSDFSAFYQGGNMGKKYFKYERYTCMIYYILVVQRTMPEELTFVEAILHENLYVLLLVRDCLQALQIVQTFKPDCFLLDEQLPTMC